MPRHVGWLALSAALVLPSPALATGGHGREFRITPDNRPGSYLRLDGTRDAVHDACSQRRRQQVNPTIAVNPHNPRVIAAGGMDACFAFRNPAPVPQPQHALGLYRSTDGGRTWGASLFPGYVVSDTGPASELACTMHVPALAFDRQGRLFVAASCPLFTGVTTADFQVAVATFDRDGSRFAHVVRADPTPPPEQERVRSIDQVTLTVDTTHSRHSGNVYVAYLDCPGAAPRGPCSSETDFTIQVVRSTNHGRTFSAPAVIAGAPDTASMPDLAVGPDGTVYVVFRSAPGGGPRPVWIARSTDGGASFSPAQLVAEFPSFDSRTFALTAVETPQCGDGPFACPSGFTFPFFWSYAQVAADESGVHVIWNQRLASGQSKMFVRSSRDGVIWSAPPVQLDTVPRGHQWFPDIGSADGVITAVFLDSRSDPAYGPDRPPGNTAQGTNPGPSTHTYIARSRDGGRTWKERRISRRPSNPNYETYIDARLPWYGFRSALSAVSGAGVLAAWTDARDVVAADDTRPDSRESGFDVYAPCAWTPNTVAGSIPGYQAPAPSDPCLDQGGLDLNLYGAWVGRGRHGSHPGKGHG
ncbi:MAG TPA: sialidase family protein [Solirubrobacter sp.]|jgi:hypothetical protein|nr:sialidase family protein [Solirubrobacter sp.]